ncbi:hypothetical protein [Paracandidimonas lactea]
MSGNKYHVIADVVFRLKMA